MVVRVAPEPVHIRRRRPNNIHEAPVPRSRIACEVHRIIRVEDSLQRQAGSGLVAGAGPGDVGRSVGRKLQPRYLRLPAGNVVSESLGSAFWQCVLQTTRRSQDSLSLRNDEQRTRSKVTAASCGAAYADRRRQLLAIRDDDRIAEGIVRRIDLLLLSEDPRGDVRRLVGHEQRVLDGGGDGDAVA